MHFYGDLLGALIFQESVVTRISHMGPFSLIIPQMFSKIHVLMPVIRAALTGSSAICVTAFHIWVGMRLLP